MLAVARAKVPDVPLHDADMRTFNLAKRFDVVACLFSSIGYVRSVWELNTAVAVMAPWFTPDQWQPGRVRGGMVVDDDDLKIVRFVIPDVRDRFAVTAMQHLVAESELRHREIGVRLALGARFGEVQRMFVRQGSSRSTGTATASVVVRSSTTSPARSVAT